MGSQGWRSSVFSRRARLLAVPSALSVPGGGGHTVVFQYTIVPRRNLTADNFAFAPHELVPAGTARCAAVPEAVITFRTEDGGLPAKGQIVAGVKSPPKACRVAAFREGAQDGPGGLQRGGALWLAVFASSVAGAFAMQFSRWCLIPPWS